MLYRTPFVVVLAGWLSVAVGGPTGTAAPLYPPFEPPLVDLIRDGRPCCEIRFSGKPTEAEAYAARELADYLKQITGATVPIARGVKRQEVFPITIATDASLGAEALLVDGDAARLRLVGGDDRGTLYAVYAFLEECLSVRWFMAGDLGEVVPKQPTVQVGKIYRREAPQMAIRWVGRDAWAQRNRMNVAIPFAPIKVIHQGHSFDSIIPPDKYFKDHPEFFSYSEKQATRTTRQLCTSNPVLVAEVIRNLREALSKDAAVKIVGLSPNDGGGFCECADCRAQDEEAAGRPSVLDINRRYSAMGEERRGALSRRMILFDNQVARALAQSHPGVYVKSFVYNSYLQPPADPSLRCEDNLLVQVCHNTCHAHPFGEHSCSYNVTFREILEGWRAKSNHVMLYEYYYKGGSLGLPWPLGHTLEADFSYMHAQGVCGLFTQYRPSATEGLNFYLAAKLCWNSAISVDALLADFFSKFYGPAAGPMRRMHDILDRRLSETKLHPSGVSDTRYLFVDDFYPPEVVSACRLLCDEAERLASEPAVRHRIAAQREAIELADLARQYYDVARTIASAPAKERSVLISQAKNRADRVSRFVKQSETLPKEDRYLQRFLDPNTILRVYQSDLARPW